MVTEENLDGTLMYKCEKCGWVYPNIELAEDCQDWCEKHKSCNPKFTESAIKLQRRSR